MTVPPTAPVQLNASGKLFLVGVVVGAGCGLGGGWALWKPRVAPVETAQVEVRQKDSSVILTRSPNAKAKPAQVIPKGDVVERVATVTVQPRAIPSSPQPVVEPVPTTSPAKDTAAATVPTVACPPVTVALTLVRQPDGTKRVIASSPDGQVTGGMDVPVEAAKPPPRVLVWSVGVVNGGRDRYGGFVSRDLGPLRVLAGGMSGRPNAGGVAFIGAGLRF